MSIYEVIFYGDSPKSNPFLCEIKNEEIVREFQLGKSYKNKEEIELKIIQKGSKDNFLKNTQKLLVVDEKVKKIMDVEDMENIEFIPIEIEQQQYYIINIVNMLYDSLDWHKSVIMTYPEDFPNKAVRGKIGTIWKTVLYKNRIKGHIFRIAEHTSDVFVDEYFKDLIEKNGFTGIDFQKVGLS